MPASGGASHVFRCPIRWGDLDAQGHVNNANYVEYLQDARVDFFLDGPNAKLLETGVVVVGHQIEFVAPIHFSTEPLEIELCIADLGAARFSVAYEMRHEGRVVARARTTLCPFDFAHNRPRRLAPSEREPLEALRREVAALRPLQVDPPGQHAMPYDLVVRWGDSDIYGHVNNVRFFDYIQEGRVAATTTLDPSMARIAGGPQGRYLWLVVRQDVDYVNQLSFRRAPYRVLTDVAKVGTSSITFSVVVDDPQNAVQFARARTVLVCGDEQGRPTPIPDDIRAVLHRAG